MVFSRRDGKYARYTVLQKVIPSPVRNYRTETAFEYPDECFPPDVLSEATIRRHLHGYIHTGTETPRFEQCGRNQDLVETIEQQRRPTRVCRIEMSDLPRAGLLWAIVHCLPKDYFSQHIVHVPATSVNQQIGRCYTWVLYVHKYMCVQREGLGSSLGSPSMLEVRTVMR